MRKIITLKIEEIITMAEDQKQNEGQHEGEVKKEEVRPAPTAEEIAKSNISTTPDALAPKKENLGQEAKAEDTKPAEVKAEVKVEEVKHEDTKATEAPKAEESKKEDTVAVSDSAPVDTGVTETSTEPSLEEMANDGSEMWSAEDDEDLLSENAIIIQQFFDAAGISADAKKLAQFLLENGIY